MHAKPASAARWWTAGLFVLAIQAACAGSSGDTMTEDAIVGTAWQIEAIAGTPILEGVEPFLVFPESDRIAGSSGCNRFTGTLALEGERVASLGPLATTRRMCRPDVMEQEQRVLEALAEAHRLVRDGATLRIVAEDGRELLRLGSPSPAETTS